MIFLYFLVLSLRDSYKVLRVGRALLRSTTNFTNFSLRFKRNGKYTQLDEQSTFHAKNLTKKFSNIDVVDNLSFTVKPGQCYGLLGVNGAGKTTTFKMLTGDEVPTSGSADIKFATHGQVDMQDWTTSDTYFQKIGYCPQFNAVNEVLTAENLLKLFAYYRGIPPHEQDSEVQAMLDRVGLEDFAKVPCGTLSGGNKRKLCLGISLIGKTAVVFLDEPTTGVDPVSRRKIWLVLADVKKESKHPLVLTSHSMDECEKLCDL